MRFVLALVGAMILAACGGTSAPQPAGSTSPSAPASVAASPPPASSPSASAPSGSAFLDLVRAGKQATFKVTYRFTASAAGQSSAVDQTWYVKGSQMRWDLASPLGGSTSFFFITDGVFLCVSEGQPSCQKLPNDQQAMLNPGVMVQDALWETPDRFDAQPVTTRTIAGVSAQCFGVNDRDLYSIGSGTMCYSPQGVLLFNQFKSSGGDFTMEATSVGTPTDNDFKLSAPVRTLP